jgi:hypothetical protein
MKIYVGSQLLKDNHGIPVNGLRCRITSGKKIYRLGDTIPIKAILENFSSKEIKITELREEFTKDSNGIYYYDDVHGFWKINIIETQGHDFKLSLDPWAPRLREKDIIILKPGGAFETTFSLHNWFSMGYQLPIGKYCISAQYIGWRKKNLKEDSLLLNWFGKVTSNTIYIQVIPNE